MWYLPWNAFLPISLFLSSPHLLPTLLSQALTMVLLPRNVPANRMKSSLVQKQRKVFLFDERMESSERTLWSTRSPWQATGRAAYEVLVGGGGVLSSCRSGAGVLLTAPGHSVGSSISAHGLLLPYCPEVSCSVLLLTVHQVRWYAQRFYPGNSYPLC